MKYDKLVYNLIEYRRNIPEPFYFAHCAGIVHKNHLVIKGDKF